MEAVDENALVLADQQRILHLLSNLIGNSVKSCPRNSTVTVEVDVRAREVVLTVRDDGAGIPADIRDHLFKQGTRTWRGAQLGLSLAQGIVQAHGGRIWTDDEQPAGTVIRIALQRA